MSIIFKKNVSRFVLFVAIVGLIIPGFVPTIANAAPSNPKLYTVAYVTSKPTSGDVTLVFRGDNIVSDAIMSAEPNGNDANPRETATKFFTSYNGLFLYVTIPYDFFFKNGKVRNIPFYLINPDGSKSNAQPYKLSINPPSILSLTPGSIQIDQADKTFYVDGEAFIKNAKIYFDGEVRNTIYISSIQLQGTLEDKDVKDIKKIKVVVKNDLGGVSPEQIYIAAYSEANVTSSSVSRITVWPAEDLSIVLGGDNFTSATKIVIKPTYTSLKPITKFEAIYVSPSEINLKISKDALIDYNATYLFKAQNPKEAGGVYYDLNYFGKASLYVDLPLPTITSLSPDNSEISKNDLKVKVKGTGFHTKTFVRVASIKFPTTLISSEELEVTIDKQILGKGGAYDFRVINDPSSEMVYRSKPFAFNVNNPVPQFDSISYKSMDSINGYLKILGKNFIDSTKLLAINFNGIVGYPVYKVISSTEIEVTIKKIYGKLDGTYKYFIKNPGPGGGETEEKSISFSSPVAYSLEPAAVGSNSKSNVIKVTGKNFSKESFVNVIYKTSKTGADISKDLDTTFIDENNLQFSLPDEATTLFSNEISVSVKTPAIIISDSEKKQNETDKLESKKCEEKNDNSEDCKALKVKQKKYEDKEIEAKNGSSFDSGIVSLSVIPSQPTITKIDPEILYTNSSTQSISLLGQNFSSTLTSVKFNGIAHSYVWKSATLISLPITSVDLKVPTVFNITVQNSGQTKVSEAIKLTVKYPAPILTGIRDGSKIVGDPAFILTLSGESFVNKSVVKINGKEYPTTFVNSTSLQVSISSDLLSKAQILEFQVVTLEPGGGESSKQTLVVQNPFPTLISLSKDSVYEQSAALELLLTGTGFNKYTVVLVNNVEAQPVYMSVTQLKLSLSETMLENPGTISIIVSNGLPGGGSSTKLLFTIQEIPAVKIISPLANTKLVAGTSVPIKWTATGIQYKKIRLSLSENNQEIVEILDSASNTGIFNWTVPNLNGIYSITLDAMGDDEPGGALQSTSVDNISISYVAPEIPNLPPPPTPPTVPTTPVVDPAIIDPIINPTSNPNSPTPIPPPENVGLLPPSTPLPNIDINVGSSGPVVQTLCSFLDANGFSTGGQCDAFNSKVSHALIQLQKEHTDNGDLGINTLRLLNDLLRHPTSEVCPGENIALIPPTKPFTRVLRFGDTGEDVKVLQKFLNDNKFYLANSGAGSPGNETVNYSDRTEGAMKRFQNAYGLISEKGKVGPKNRRFINNLMVNPPASSCSPVVVETVKVCEPYLTKYIKASQDNDKSEVKKLQEFLVKYEGFGKLKLSGVYDKSTLNAVIDFQEKYLADILGPWNTNNGSGYVYKTTVKKINEIVCKNTIESIIF